MAYMNNALSVFEEPFLHHGMEPHFGMGLLPSDFFSDRIIPRSGMHHLPTGYRRPWQIARQAVSDFNKDQKSLHIGKDGFQACVDVHHFEPSEITVKTAGHAVTIEGRHEERSDDHGSVQRHFLRKYILPKDFDMSAVQSNLSSDGVLTIKAPPPAIEGMAERHVPITHINAPAHLSVKDNKPAIEAVKSGNPH